MGVLPPGHRGGTSLNPSITSYEDLSIRVQHQLGAPLINLEVTDEQIYTFIDMAMEYFTKWAGYTEEYLIFNSKLYKQGVGIKVDDLINTTPEMYKSVVEGLSAGFDYDMDSYRKVIDCFEFSKGEDTGINTLFTLEHSLANQVYAQYLQGGSYGFDLMTWETLKQFIDTRNRSLAMTPHFRFDPFTQVLKIIPEPRSHHTYMGVVGCYIERPIKDLIKEPWIHRFTKVLTQIAMARIKEKYGSNLMGGGSVNFSNLLQEGLKEKDELELELKNSYSYNSPAQFFVGIFLAFLVPAFLFAQNFVQNIVC